MEYDLLFQMFIWVSETQYISDIEMAFCKLFDYKEESNLWKDGQTILLLQV